MKPAEIEAHLREAFEERAAIAEFDGRMTRREAESLARGENRRLRRHLEGKENEGKS